MLGAPGLSAFNFSYDNWGANPSSTPGTAITPGASNVEGAWTQIATGSNISSNVYWIRLQMVGGATSTAQKDHLLDLGVDNAGGTSYSAVVSNMACGQSPIAGLLASRGFLFPIFIKSGSSVAVRIQGQNATAGTVRVSAKFYGDPSNPENAPVGQYSETIGTITNSQGVAFTPGNAADGTWVSLGTTANDMWWWQLAPQASNGTLSALQTYVDLAYGDGTNKVVIQRQLIQTDTTEEVVDLLTSNFAWLDCYRFVPAGSTIYVRGRCSAAPNTGWNAVAIGVGG